MSRFDNTQHMNVFHRYSRVPREILCGFDTEHQPSTHESHDSFRSNFDPAFHANTSIPQEDSQSWSQSSPESPSRSRSRSHSHSHSHSPSYSSTRIEEALSPASFAPENTHLNHTTCQVKEDECDGFELPRLSRADALQLLVGDVIDCRDSVGRFLLAMVVKLRIRKSTNPIILVQFLDFSTEKNVCLDLDKDDQLNRLAPPRSISRRPKHRMQNLREGDMVDVLSHRTKSWVSAEMTWLDHRSGQVSVTFCERISTSNAREKRFTHWFHLDDNQEVSWFATRCNVFRPPSSQQCSFGDGLNVRAPPFCPSWTEEPREAPSHQNDELRSVSIEENERKESQGYPPCSHVDACVGVELPRLTLEKANQLRNGSELDYRDKCGRFLLSTVVEFKGKKNRQVLIRFMECSRKKMWISLRKCQKRLAEGRSISYRPANRMKDLEKGDMIDVLHHHKNVWVSAVICELDKRSGQVRVEYPDSASVKDKSMKYHWFHLDDKKEVAVIGTQCDAWEPSSPTNSPSSKTPRESPPSPQTYFDPHPKFVVPSPAPPQAAKKPTSFPAAPYTCTAQAPTTRFQPQSRIRVRKMTIDQVFHLVDTLKTCGQHDAALGFLDEALVFHHSFQDEIRRKQDEIRFLVSLCPRQ